MPSSTPRQPRRIGVLIPIAGGFYFGDVLLGIEAAAVRHGIQPIVTQTAVPWPTAVTGHPVLGTYTPVAVDHVDGFIVVLEAIGRRDIFALMASGKPVVTMPSTHPAPNGVSVHADNAGGTASAVRHLLRHGRRRIAFVGCLRQDEIRERYAGYRSALEQYGIEPDEMLCFDVPDNLEGGGHAGAAAMLRAGVEFDAVCGGTDLNAIGVQDVLLAAGRRIPEDVALVGFDDCEEAQHAVPPLTTVRQRYDSIGEAAVDALVAVLAGAPPARNTLVLPTTLVRRHSCGCGDMPFAEAEPAIEWLSAGWREELAMSLALRLVAPVRPEPGTAPEAIWPGVSSLVEALDAAASRREGPPATDLDRAWQAATHRTRTADTLNSLVDLLEAAARARQESEGPGLEPALHAFIAQCRLQMLRSAVIDLHPPSGVKGVLGHVGRAFLRRRSDDRAHLTWMSLVPALQGCLGLWETPIEEASRFVERAFPSAAAHLDGSLRVALSWHADKDRAIATGAALPAGSFPPREWLDRALEGPAPGTVTIIPIGTPDRDWGMLAAVDSSEDRFFDSYDTLSQGATELTVALEHDTLIDAVERQRAQVAESEARYHSLFENPHAVMFLVDPGTGLIVDANAAASAFYGYTHDEFLARPFSALQVPGSAPVRGFVEQLTAKQTVRGLEHCLKDGAVRIVDAYGGAMAVSGRQLVYAIVHDVTDQYRAELRVQERERYFRALVEQSTDLVLVVGADGFVRYASPSHERLLGRSPQQIEGLPATDLLDRESVTALTRALAEAAASSEPVEAGELSVRHADGSHRILHTLVTSRLDDPAVCGLILNSYDITARKRMEIVLAEQAQSDALTGLPNRRVLMEQLSQAVAIGRRDGSTFGLLMLDVDRFKDVNDAYGHHAGDLLLCEFAARLRSATRETDTVARLGGDEFAVISRGSRGAAGTAALARRVSAALRAPMTIDGQAVAIRASIGIAVFPEHGPDAEILLRHADGAMYEAKRLRRRYAVYEPEGPVRRPLRGRRPRAVERRVDPAGVVQSPVERPAAGPERDDQRPREAPAEPSLEQRATRARSTGRRRAKGGRESAA